jgi:uncharacterized membrane protein
MPKTIGNPLSWAFGALGTSAEYAASVAEAVGADASAPPQIRKLTYDDLKIALTKGFDDMGTFRSDVIFVCILYPLMGMVLVALALQGDYVQLLFPVLSGFALTGPVAAVGLYEMSRRREKGIPVNWMALIDVLRSPKFGGVMVLALFHVVIFIIWVMAADLIYTLTIGPSDAPQTMMGFAQTVLTTPAGWAMIVIGMAVGFVFAAIVLAISVVSFPLLLDRNVGLAMAVSTSVRVARANPGPIAMWGLIVAGSLALGSIPALLGLVIVMPVLGHATWHLYRRAVI